MTDMAGSGSILGNPVVRLEDPTLLTGEGKYVDDLVEPGMLYVALVRSSVAHGTSTRSTSALPVDAGRGCRVSTPATTWGSRHAGIRDVAAHVQPPDLRQ